MKFIAVFVISILFTSCWNKIYIRNSEFIESIDSAKNENNLKLFPSGAYVISYYRDFSKFITFGEDNESRYFNNYISYDLLDGSLPHKNVDYEILGILMFFDGNRALFISKFNSKIGYPVFDLKDFGKIKKFQNDNYGKKNDKNDTKRIGFYKQNLNEIKVELFKFSDSDRRGILTFELSGEQLILKHYKIINIKKGKEVIEKYESVQPDYNQINNVSLKYYDMNQIEALAWEFCLIHPNEISKKSLESLRENEFQQLVRKDDVVATQLIAYDLFNPSGIHTSDMIQFDEKFKYIIPKYQEYRLKSDYMIWKIKDIKNDQIIYNKPELPNEPILNEWNLNLIKQNIDTRKFRWRNRKK